MEDKHETIINEDFFHKNKEEKETYTVYVNMKLMIDKYMRPWVDDYKKAFKLLDKKGEYNIVILLKADYCSKVDEKTITIKNLKKTMIIDSIE